LSLLRGIEGFSVGVIIGVTRVLFLQTTTLAAKLRFVWKLANKLI
jgi:hypothetical protein